MKLAQLCKYLALGALVTGFYGCGGSSGNDQGTSFTNLGFFVFDDDEDFECGDLPPQGLFGTVQPLGFSGDQSGGVVAALGLQNNLSGQTIRPDRVLLDFYVPGSNVNPPSTTTSLGGILGPGDGTAGDSSSSSSGGGQTVIDTTLPPSFDSICNQGFYNIYVVPPAVMSFINLNRDSFPETPFIMEVRVTASGVTSAGDRLESNQQVFFVEFTPETTINPGSAADDGGEEEEEEVPTL
ncbi:MAG: hypothetical protein QY326_04490 [Bdellovibrionota bacterium]|nr:MAG: hypothetical protein QY326_04490 [Bdellovibrionota bacterium]